MRGYLAKYLPRFGEHHCPRPLFKYKSLHLALFSDMLFWSNNGINKLFIFKSAIQSDIARDPILASQYQASKK